MYFAGLAFPGFTTVIILELLIGGVLMVSLGIIGTYIAQIYQEVKYRPRYVIAEALTSNKVDQPSYGATTTEPQVVTTMAGKSPV
jgi:polyisoprenyl-phosphate glycosyltransferase